MANIVRRLSVACLDDIQGDELLVLMAPGESSEAIADCLRKADVPTRKPVDSATETLISRGYLTHKESPVEPGQVSISITKRGAAARKQVIEELLLQRWADFPFRDGDIVISAAPKSGTTWVQTICALLIFQTPDLPAPVQELSPWIDSRQNERDQLFAQLAAQEHRRFLKTHVPLDKMTLDPRVTYIGVARHPLDSAVSFHHQMEMLRGESKKPLPPARDQLLKFVNAEEVRGDDPIVRQIGIIAGAWARREEPNVTLLHYQDLRDDLEGQMRALAARLDITVPEAAWPSLVKAATLDQMRAAAARIQPLHELKNPADFFWKGTSGSGRALLTDDELDLYLKRAGDLAPAELVTWLHR